MVFQFIVAALVVASASADLVADKDYEYPKIRDYTPLTDVSQQMALSLDLSLVSQMFKKLDEDTFDDIFLAAEQIYMHGGNSIPLADLEIPDGLPFGIDKGTKFKATAKDGTEFIGKAENSANKGAKSLKFRYPNTKEDGALYNCRVGGLPSDKVVKDGCLPDSGELKVTESGEHSDKKIPYQYVIRFGNINGRSLASLSTEDNKRMRPEKDKPYFASFQPFFDYYGTYAYAHEIILASFQSEDTNFKRDNFLLQSQHSDYEARREIIEKGTAVLSVGMNVLRELEYAVYQCEECTKKDNGDDDNDCHSHTAAINALDQAVAFYHGQDDNFFHRLANKRGSNFGTCDGRNKWEGEAKVNAQVFGDFNHMQEYLQEGNCAGAREKVNEITKQMWVPLIQGNLRYAWMLSDQNPDSYISSKGHQAMGAIYAAGILPLIYECDEKAANVIYRNMKVRDTGVVDDFASIKAAFESCYHFLGITCADVGALNHTSHLTNACIDKELSDGEFESSSSRKGVLVFGVLLTFLLLIGLGIAYWRYFVLPNKQLSKDVPEQPLPSTKKITSSEVI